MTFAAAVARSALPLLLMLGPALAEEPCPAAPAFRSAIVNCGANTVATEHARVCAAHVHAEGAALSAGASAAEASANPARMRREARGFVSTFRAMQAEVDRVANYTEAMIDLPGSRSAAESLDCFNTEFDAIQRLVDAMDEDLVAARGQIEKLRATYARLVGPAAK